MFILKLKVEIITQEVFTISEILTILKMNQVKEKTSSLLRLVYGIN